MPTTQTEEATAGFLPFEPVREPRAGRILPSGFAGSADGPGAGALLRFRTLMAAQGQSVQLARLCYDRLYAYERIAAAHAAGGEELRRLALELFQIYQRRPAGLQAQ